MKCPFLKDASVEYCEASAYRKLLPKEAINPQGERCSTSAWTGCSESRQRIEDDASLDRCPFLHDSRAEYCAAASVMKFIPATDDLLSRCNSDAHLYCELYLLHADPAGERLLHRRDAVLQTTHLVDGLPVPPHLHYAPNHMWLDVSEDGSCHIGIDAFAASVFGSIDGVTFAPQRPGTFPTAVLRVGGVDIPMTFPEPLGATANLYLRTATGKLTEDPYGAGWLFECSGRSAIRAEEMTTPLVSGEAAVEWMRDERWRLDQFAHERAAMADADGIQTVADGGTVIDGLATHLDRDDLIALALEFFTIQTHWRRSP